MRTFWFIDMVLLAAAGSATIWWHETTGGRSVRALVAFCLGIAVIGNCSLLLVGWLFGISLAEEGMHPILLAMPWLIIIVLGGGALILSWIADQYEVSDMVDRNTRLVLHILTIAALTLACMNGLVFDRGFFVYIAIAWTAFAVNASLHMLLAGIENGFTTVALREKNNG